MIEGLAPTDHTDESHVRDVTTERTEFRTRTRSMGRALVDLDKANDIAAGLPDQGFGDATSE